MSDSIKAKGPLSGIRVVDLTSVVFGPYATQIMADMGAEVIKVEPPAGDNTRWISAGPSEGMGGVYVNVNRGKRSLLLDLRRDEDKDVLRRLIATANVFIHSMRAKAIARLGFDYDAVKAIRPDIVYTNCYGYSRRGPEADQPAYDDTIQAEVGITHVQNLINGEPGFVGTIMADKVAGQMAVHAILAALFQRERTGWGQTVEVPMFEAVTSFVLVEHLYGGHWQPSQTDRPDSVAELGYPRLFAAWRRPYRTADGYACVMPYTNENWRRFFQAIDRQDLSDDPRFQSIAGRTEHVQELLRLVGSIVVSEPTEYWLSLCRELDIPCSAVNRLEDLEADPHLRAVGFFQSLPLCDGEFRFPRCALRLSDSHVVPRPPPRLGEHSEEVLSSLDLPETVLAEILLRP